MPMNHPSVVQHIYDFYPIVPLCVCLILGIVTSACWIEVTDLRMCFAVLLLLLVASILLSRHPAMQTWGILASFFMLGITYTVHTESTLKLNFPKGEMVYEAVVASQPIERQRVVRFDMIITSGQFAGKKVRATMLKDTATNNYRNLHVNSGFVASSRLEPTRNFRESNFNYVTYLKSHGIAAQTFIFYNRWRARQVSLTSLSRLDRTRLKALEYRNKLLGKYKALGLDNDIYSVVAAMTLGDKSAISPSTRNIYSMSGASHVLALSGLHLGILYMFLSMVFLKQKSMLVELLLVVSVWLFVLLVGCSPSVVRAAIMVSVCSVVRVSGRRNVSLNVLAFAALIMLLANPLCLFDVGFQLSFMAVLFIVVFSWRTISAVPASFRRNHRLLNWIWSLTVVSTMAQLGTAPLVAYYFGTLPVYFLLTNLIVIPAATIILYSCAIFFAISLLPLTDHYVIAVIKLSVSLLNTSLSWISSLPGASITNISIGKTDVLAIYVAITAVLCLIIYAYRHLNRRIIQNVKAM